MAKKFIKGQKYTHEEYMQHSIEEMRRSKSEHTHKTDPKVGAVLVDKEGRLVEKAHRGEIRKGDHAEYTIFSKKLRTTDVTGFTPYTTLEPCVERNEPKTGCSFHTIDARIAKVFIGHKDPDPSVAGDGIKLLEDAKIEVGYYDKKYNEIIAKENEIFFEEARLRAKEADGKEITPALSPFESELSNFTLSDFSEEAQREMIDKMDLKFKMGSDAYNNFLFKLGLIKVKPKAKTAKPTGLGILLLGKQPELQFPQSRVKFTIRRENEDPIIKDFDGPLVLLPDKIEEYLEVIFPKEISRTGFQRNVKQDIPYRALLEVIMNAIVHRDYTIDNARIMIEVDKNKVVVSSPGIPLAPLDKFKTFSVASNSRNPKIAFILFEMGLVEERGFGMEELSKLEKQGYPKPEFELDGQILKTIIYRGGTDMQKKENLKGLKELLDHRVLTSEKYVQLTGVSERTARRHLNDLVKADKAIKEGDGPATEYRIKD
ncbi:MAG: DeoR family transcriptional regulator [Chitinophagaceae bacterium]|nr:MAG: DeoR family transcriptional regulator [Chitinophagaceae bacterium]